MQVFEQVGTTDQMCKVLLTIVLDLESLMAKQVLDIETHAISILGDLKALSLFYVPICQQKGPGCRNPLPSPAPSLPNLHKTLTKFQAYLERLLMLKRTSYSQSKKDKALEDKSKELQQQQQQQQPVAKKRKLEGGNVENCEKEEEPGASTSAQPVLQEPGMLLDAETQRNIIAQDLIALLQGTIDTLLRGVHATGGTGGQGRSNMMVGEDASGAEDEEEEEDLEEEDIEPEVDVEEADNQTDKHKGKVQELGKVQPEKADKGEDKEKEGNGGKGEAGKEQPSAT